VNRILLFQGVAKDMNASNEPLADFSGHEIYKAQDDYLTETMGGKQGWRSLGGSPPVWDEPRPYERQAKRLVALSLREKP